jgi:hypothetical protein
MDVCRTSSETVCSLIRAVGSIQFNSIQFRAKDIDGRMPNRSRFLH